MEKELAIAEAYAKKKHFAGAKYVGIYEGMHAFELLANYCGGHIGMPIFCCFDKGQLRRMSGRENWEFFGLLIKEG